MLRNCLWKCVGIWRHPWWDCFQGNSGFYGGKVCRIAVVQDLKILFFE